MRFRYIFLFGGSLAVMAALFFTDPDKGMGFGMLMLSLVTPLIAVAFAHLARKALHDYPEADAKILFWRAAQSPTGAGLALVALSIVLFGLLGLFGRAAHAQDVRSFVPAGAYAYGPVLNAEQRAQWPDHPAPELLAALVEQESCISLTHSKCWSPAARLKTAREEGAGMGQITRAYRPDGSLRFDSLSDMRAKHPALAAWSWQNVYQRPDLQLRAIVLQMRDQYRQSARLVPKSMRAYAFADAAYNGGPGGVLADRRACGLTAGCDPQQWFGHVEHTCTKSKSALYGQRSACDINREHVRMVMLVRSAKYRDLMT